MYGSELNIDVQAYKEPVTDIMCTINASTQLV